jgi:hypothetical protein
MRLSPNIPPRRGFTLVELLVACALTVLVMAVMSTAFQVGMATLSHLKSTVGLSEKLRSSEALIRRDLQADHLHDGDGLTVQLSNPNLASQPWNAAGAKGYFEVIHGSAPGSASYVSEGTQDNVTSYRATDHALFFTSKLPAQTALTVYTGDVPPGPVTVSGSYPPFFSLPGLAPAGNNVMAAGWAEIGLFLVQSNRFTTQADGTNSLPLYSLVRRQRVIGPMSVQMQVSATTRSAAIAMRDSYPEASLSTYASMTNPPAPATPVPYVLMNGPSSVISRVNRLGYVWDGNTPPPNTLPVALPVLPDSNPAATPQTNYSSLKSQGSTQGTDLLLNDVVSMEIRVMDATGVFKRLDQVPSTVGAAGDRRLDSANAAGFGTQIRAIQIKLRVYDTANHLTRQSTINVDL